MLDGASQRVWFRPVETGNGEKQRVREASLIERKPIWNISSFISGANRAEQMGLHPSHLRYKGSFWFLVNPYHVFLWLCRQITSSATAAAHLRGGRCTERSLISSSRPATRGRSTSPAAQTESSSTQWGTLSLYIWRQNRVQLDVCKQYIMNTDRTV